MKIMVGMGSIDDYPAFVHAGAKEIFVGYVPHFWMKKYGSHQALNRREVLYYNVQIGSFSELMILSEMVKKYKVPVSIALNALHYKKECYEDLFEIMESCMSLGFSSFIVADGDFLKAVFKKKIAGLEMIVSGEYGEINAGIVSEFEDNKVKRIIFPRQTTIEEMRELVQLHPNLEYEAFALNEKCHFTGAYCNSIHCDEFCHMCKVPFLMGGKERLDEISDSSIYEEEEPVTGFSGCALCAFWDYWKIGITHLKIVSRGNGSQATETDIKKVEEALIILKQCQSKAEYIKKMKKTLFPRGCSHNCYASSLPERI
ncbi:MAG: U32 family peptidase [Eubacteriales bacterium]|nr:U32 family peptidase [Eubacteriales bacterium]